MLASVVWCLCTANLADGDFENILRRIFSINLTITTAFVTHFPLYEIPRECAIPPGQRDGVKLMVVAPTL